MTSWTLRRIPLALLTILVPALLIACEDSGGLSRSDIQQIVQSELANNPAPVDQGSSRQQVEQIVGTSIPIPRKSTPDEFTNTSSTGLSTSMILKDSTPRSPTTTPAKAWTANGMFSL